MSEDRAPYLVVMADYTSRNPDPDQGLLPSHEGLAIISGAQTGIDRGALDAALDAGCVCGGWVPRGRKAEDGRIPDRYPVTERDGDYPQRTRANVEDSDATVLIYFHTLTGGTELTLRFCMAQKKPYLLLDASEISEQRAAKRISQFVHHNSIRRLNVAGPRESTAPGAWAYAYVAIQNMLTSEK